MAGKLAYPPRHMKLLRINWQELGHVAARRLVARMEGVATAGEVIQIVPHLIEINGDQVTPLDAAAQPAVADSSNSR
jgi:hypothetical protein